MTETQKQVGGPAALGKSEREIAQLLIISPSAVRSILKHILKLQEASRPVPLSVLAFGTLGCVFSFTSVRSLASKSRREFA